MSKVQRILEGEDPRAVLEQGKHPTATQVKNQLERLKRVGNVRVDDTSAGGFTVGFEVPKATPRIELEVELIEQGPTSEANLLIIERGDVVAEETLQSTADLPQEAKRFVRQWLDESNIFMPGRREDDE